MLGMSASGRSATVHHAASTSTSRPILPTIQLVQQTNHRSTQTNKAQKMPRHQKLKFGYKFERVERQTRPILPAHLVQLGVNAAKANTRSVSFHIRGLSAHIYSSFNRSIYFYLQIDPAEKRAEQDAFFQERQFVGRERLDKLELVHGRQVTVRLLQPHTAVRLGLKREHSIQKHVHFVLVLQSAVRVDQALDGQLVLVLITQVPSKRLLLARGSQQLQLDREPSDQQQKAGPASHSPRV